MVTKMSSPVAKLPEFPELTAAKNRLAKVMAANEENRKQTQKLIAEINGSTNSSHRERQIALAADKLLEAGELSEAGDTFASLNQALQTRWREKVVIDEAILTAERQVDVAQSMASRELAAKLTPEYRALLARMKSAIVELQAAVMAEHEFYNRVEDAGFAGMFSYLERMPFAGAGFISREDVDPASHIRTWLNQLKQYHPGV